MTSLAFRNLVLQPTSLCNVNCSYCYLSERQANRKTGVEVAERLATSLKSRTEPLRIIWHGGEPLSCGIEHFRNLLAPFDSLLKQGIVSHSIQTNGTLINEAWCHLFRQNAIAVSVSIDGPQWSNDARVDWAGKPIFDRVLRGIDCLRRDDISFTALCVIGRAGLARAREIYNFFVDLGCEEVGFNIEQTVGINRAEPLNGAHVERFWLDLFHAWRDRPAIKVRELSYAIGTLAVPGDTTVKRAVDLIPSVAHNGNVVLLSPEFLDARSKEYDDFIAGNILRESVIDICDRAARIRYVVDFLDGIDACSRMCEYYSVCVGGDAATKFFELGTTGGTVTAGCRYSEKALMNAVVEAL